MAAGYSSCVHRRCRCIDRSSSAEIALFSHVDCSQTGFSEKMHVRFFCWVARNLHFPRSRAYGHVCVGLIMSGPLKLKIKLKPKPQEPETASARSDHKRKLDEYSPQASGLLSSAGNGTEVKRAKKQKQHQQVPNQTQSTASGSKVKLHIKGPWGKAVSASDKGDSPYAQSSLRPFQPDQAQSPAAAKPSLVIKHRPPVKSSQIPAALNGTAPSKKKQKGSGTAQHAGPPALALQPRDSTASGGLSALPGQAQDAGAAQAQSSIKLGHQADGGQAPAYPTRALLERVVDKMQRKDTFSIFKNPVTEAMVSILPISTSVCQQ